MKNQLAMVFFQMGQMAWVRYFYAGFIVGKVPFPLTQGFKGNISNYRYVAIRN